MTFKIPYDLCANEKVKRCDYTRFVKNKLLKF